MLSARRVYPFTNKKMELKDYIGKRVTYRQLQGRQCGVVLKVQGDVLIVKTKKGEGRVSVSDVLFCE